MSRIDLDQTVQILEDSPVDIMGMLDTRQVLELARYIRDAVNAAAPEGPTQLNPVDAAASRRSPLTKFSFRLGHLRRRQSAGVTDLELEQLAVGAGLDGDDGPRLVALWKRGERDRVDGTWVLASNEETVRAWLDAGKSGFASIAHSCGLARKTIERTLEAMGVTS